MKTPPHSPEPWSLDLPGNPNTGINDRHGNPILTETGNAPFAAEGMKKLADAERVMRCVNALAGIEDPEEAIREAREVIAAMLKYYAPASFDTVHRGHEDSLRHEVKLAHATLAKLTPKPGPWDGIDADEFVRAVRDGSYQPKEEE